MAAEVRSWYYALTLLAGSVAVAVGGMRHPVLEGDGPAQLMTIALAPGWRATHWLFAAGYVAVVAGLAGLAAAHAGTAGERAARTGALTSVFGYAVSLVGILFMLGAAATLADAYVRAEPGLAGTRAVFTYDMLHPSAQAAVRIGAAGIALGLVAFGWATVRGGILPRWLGWPGVIGGLGGVGASVVGAPDTPLLVAGVGMATLWQSVAAVTVLAAGMRGRGT